MPKTKAAQLNRDIAMALANHKDPRSSHATVKKGTVPIITEEDHKIIGLLKKATAKKGTVPIMTEEDHKIIGLLKKARMEQDHPLAAMCQIALRADEENPAVQAAVAYCKRALKVMS